MRGKRVAVAAAVAGAAAFAYTAWLWGTITRRERERLAELLGWRSGRTVADVGAGGGRLAMAAAEHVGPAGRVFATEIDSRKTARIRRRAAGRKLSSLTVLPAGEHDSGLPAGCCDAILLRGSYHHFTDPAGVNASLYRALRPGGVMVVLDFQPRSWLTRVAPVKGAPPNRGGHGIPRDLLIRELEGAGFEVAEIIPRWFWDIYGVVFRKPA